MRTDNERLLNELAQIKIELDECRAEAMSSRQEVSRVCNEIENYARILEAMETKLIEAEDRAISAEKNNPNYL